MEARYRNQLIVFGAVAALFSIAGLVGIAFGIRMYAENRAFADGAEEADGVVTGFKKWESGTGSDERENIYYARVRFALDDGTEIEFVGPSRDGLVRLNEGDAVRVLYYPDKPENARVDSFMGLWFGATMLCAIGAAAVLIPLFTMWQAWRWVKAQEVPADA